ncbi:cytochrome C oxidase subunit II [Paenisporosarcina sp. FSL H8-0542]|nr:cytochrome C oxidase subunit II [Paenisporosarcina sp. HGH0030]
MSKKNQSPELNLKGTLISVFSVGIIIIVMWFVVYFMYVAR